MSIPPDAARVLFQQRYPNREDIQYDPIGIRAGTLTLNIRADSSFREADYNSVNPESVRGSILSFIERSKLDIKLVDSELPKSQRSQRMNSEPFEIIRDFINEYFDSLCQRSIEVSMSEWNLEQLLSITNTFSGLGIDSLFFFQVAQEYSVELDTYGKWDDENEFVELMERDPEAYQLEDQVRTEDRRRRRGL